MDCRASGALPQSPEVGNTIQRSEVQQGGVEHVQEEQGGGEENGVVSCMSYNLVQGEKDNDYEVMVDLFQRLPFAYIYIIIQ